MPSLLLIEDDEIIGVEIVEALKLHGYFTHWMKSAKEAIGAASPPVVDLVIVDRMLPDGDGLDVLRSLRANGLQAPVLVVSALSRCGERIARLLAEGDDYLVKPFAFGELLARLEALLQRPCGPAPTQLRFQNLELNLVASSARRGARDLDLSPREFRLLVCLMRRHGQVVTRQMLLHEIWEYDFEPHSDFADVHMSRLRRKLENSGEPGLIEKVPGIGYKFATDEPFS